MNISKLFQKTRKQSIESLEFLYVMFDTQIYLSKYEKNQNQLVVMFLKVIKWSCSWQINQIDDYVQSLRDDAFWKNREYYRENIQKFLAYELTPFQFIDQILCVILSDRREARDLEVNFYEQAKIVLDPNSFGFSKILWDLPLILEGFDDYDGPEEDLPFITEEELREIIKQVSRNMDKYFINNEETKLLKEIMIFFIILTSIVYAFLKPEIL